MKNLIPNTNLLTIDSREVARMMEKRHTDLLRDIKTFSSYLASSIERRFALNEFWQKSSYTDSIGRTLKCYLITKKGCEFIAHKMTGRKGAIFTATYINRFHEMEQALKTGMLPQRHEIVKKTYRGKLVMSVVDMASLLNTAYYNIYGLLKNNNINYTVLKSRDMVEFKRENQGKIDPFITNMIIIDQMQAYRLAKCERCNQAVFEALKDYFGEFKKEIPMVVDVNNKQLVEYIQEVRNYIIAMNVILDTLGQYQTEQDFNERENTLSHVVGNLFGKVHSFKRTTKKLIPAPAGLLL